MLRYKTSTLLLIGYLLFPNAYADEVIGYVKTSTPEAMLQHANNTVPATVGTAVYEGCTIKTDAKGSIGITLKDNTILSFGADTEFTISHYIYRPTEEKLSLDVNLLKGTLHYISGVIAKLKPDAVKIHTPAGIIGVRGTHFVVKVED